MARLFPINACTVLCFVVVKCRERHSAASNNRSQESKWHIAARRANAVSDLQQAAGNYLAEPPSRSRAIGASPKKGADPKQRNHQECRLHTDAATSISVGYPVAQRTTTMVIRFTSTLTADDEALIAPALLKALGNLLAPFPISYSVRIETTEGEIIEDGRTAPRSEARQGPGSNGRRDLFGPRDPSDLLR